MNKYFYPIYKTKLKPWIKYWLIKRTSVKPVTGTYTRASGQSPLTITKALKAPIRDLNLYGDCYQVQREGNNLFNKDDSSSIFMGYIDGSSQSLKYTTSARTAFISCSGNTTYTISRTVGKRFIVGTTIDLPANNVAVSDRITNNEAAKITITTNASAKYLVVFYYLSTQDTLTEEQIRNSIMINLGSEALPYEPYGYKPSPTNPSEVQTITGQTTFSITNGTESGISIIPLGSIELCKIGEYQDRIYKDPDNKWHLEKNIGKVELNGSETITSGEYLTQGRFEIQNYTGLKGSAGNPNCLCNYFKASFDTNNGSIFVSGVNGRINMVDTTYSSNVDGFKTWLASNKPKVYYVLSSAVVTEITDNLLLTILNGLENLETFKGTNEITFSDLSPNISFEYLKEDEV